MIAREHLLPEVEAGNPAKAAGDIFCLGKVMQRWTVLYPTWPGDHGLDLLAAMMEADPAKRPTAAAALTAPWLA